MARQISASVGLKARNIADDVTTVQELLNQVSVELGGPPSPITVDGLNGPETVGAITRFQRTNFGWGDGRVDPNGQTIAQLNACADGSAVPAPKPSPLGGGGAKPKPAASGGNGKDPSSTKGAVLGDSICQIMSCMGPVFANDYVGMNGPAFPGEFLMVPSMIWTFDIGSAVVRFLPSGRVVHISGSSVFFTNQGGPVPSSSVTYYRDTKPPAGYVLNGVAYRNTPKKSGAPTPSGPPAPYYQVGMTAPTPGTVKLNSKEGQITAPYYQDKSVSPGYFNQ